MEQSPGEAGGDRSRVAHSRRPFHPDEPCRNCGDPAPGNYCPACGQAKRDVAVSVRAMLADILEDQFVVSRAGPRTLQALLLRPGHLTREYLDGRRVRYIPPFRLYLALSVLFFLLFSMFGLRSLEHGADDVGTRVDSALAALDSLPGGGPVAADSATRSPDAGLQPWARNLRVNLGSEATNQRVRQRTIDRFGHLPAAQAMRGFLAEYLRYLPQTVFLLLPVFALILGVLHLGSGRYYAEHFVFSLHIHAFVFAAALPGIFVGWTVWSAVLGLALVVHVWIALRRVYGKGVVGTTVREIALGLAYSFTLLIGLSLTMIWTFLRL